MSAYRDLRRSGKVDDTYIGEGGNDSTVLQGSPGKSLFATLRKKSASRDRSGHSQVRTSINVRPAGSLAEQMSRISKSRSRSRAGMERTVERGSG